MEFQKTSNKEKIMNYTMWYKQQGLLGEQDLWISGNLMLETIMGSHAYGCHTISSDYDILGIVMPQQLHLFPQNYGFILGFDQLPNFKRKELKGPTKRVTIGKQEVEAEWISLVEFFVEAGIKGSPNLMECLFAKRALVTVGTKSGFSLRDNRQKFLSMRTYHSFKGYAHGQMHRIRSRKAETEDRQKMIERYGFDCKMAYHTIRLLDQIDQILRTGDIDLMRCKEECKIMRKGEWGDLDRLEKVFQEKMDGLEKLAITTKLAEQPQKGTLKTLLLSIIDNHYDLDNRRKETEYISTKDVNDKLDLILTKINEIENG